MIFLFLLAAVAVFIVVLFFIFSRKKNKNPPLEEKNISAAAPILQKIPLRDEKSFYERSIKGDGNCFYRSLALFIYHDENMYDKVRQDLSLFFRNLSPKGQNKYYKIKKMSVGERRQKLLGTLHCDNGWGGIDECNLVVIKYNRGIFIRNLFSNKNGNSIDHIYSFNIYLPNFESILYFRKKNPSFKELITSLADHINESSLSEMEKRYLLLWKKKKDFIFMSCLGSHNNEMITGYHYETFWPQ